MHHPTYRITHTTAFVTLVIQSNILYCPETLGGHAWTFSRYGHVTSSSPPPPSHPPPPYLAPNQVTAQSQTGMIWTHLNDLLIFSYVIGFLFFFFCPHSIATSFELTNRKTPSFLFSHRIREPQVFGSTSRSRMNSHRCRTLDAAHDKNNIIRIIILYIYQYLLPNNALENMYTA